MNLTFNEEMAAATIYELNAGNLSAIEVVQIRQQALEQVRSSNNCYATEAATKVFRACGDHIRAQSKAAIEAGEMVERVTGFEDTSDEVLNNILCNPDISNSHNETDIDLRKRASYERGRRSVEAREAAQAAELKEYGERREIEKRYEQKKQASHDHIAALKSVPITSIRDMSQGERESHYKNLYQARTEAGHVKADILNDINKQQAALAYEYGINDSVTFDQ